MTDKPDFPLAAQARIEDRREKAKQGGVLAYLMLFPSFHREWISGRSLVRKPATIKLELKRYSSELFDAEAEEYLKLPNCVQTLPNWLGSLRTDVENDIMTEERRDSDAFHCSKDQQRKAIRETLDERYTYWLQRAAAPKDHAGNATRATARAGAKSGGGRMKRMPATITSPIAARRMESYMASKGIGQTEFAVQIGTTDRTLRTFSKTGKVRRDIFNCIAQAMGTTKAELLKS
jgi:hypothetical protein